MRMHHGIERETVAFHHRRAHRRRRLLERGPGRVGIERSRRADRLGRRHARRPIEHVCDVKRRQNRVGVRIRTETAAGTALGDLHGQQTSHAAVDDREVLDDRVGRPASRRRLLGALVGGNGVERCAQDRALCVQILEQLVGSWMHNAMLDSIGFHRGKFMSGVARRFSVRFCVAALALTAGWNFGARAQTPAAQPPADVEFDQAVLKAFQWRSIGPRRGGRSIAVSGVKGRPREAYFGATGGGLWKTTDGGATWAPVTDGQIKSASVGAVAVSESNPDVVFIGMGESCIRGNIMPGDGIYKSTDAGKTWTHVGFGDSDAIAKIRIHPTNPDIVFVADFGKYGAPSDERGVFKSVDGGRTWKKVLFKDNKTGAVDVAFDRRNPNVMFAGLWEAYRVEYQMSSGGPGSGFYKSTDGGETWREITRNPGLPAGLVGKISVSVSGADSNRVYALVENENGGLFSSDDAGATWKLVNAGRNIRQRAFYYKIGRASCRESMEIEVSTVS